MHRFHNSKSEPNFPDPVFYASNLMPRKSLENQKTKWHPDLVPHSVISP